MVNISDLIASAKAKVGQVASKFDQDKSMPGFQLAKGGLMNNLASANIVGFNNPYRATPQMNQTLNTLQSIPRFTALSNQVNKIQNPWTRGLASLPVGFAEGVVNAPGDILAGSAGINQQFNNLINRQPVDLSKTLSSAGRFGEGVLNAATAGVGPQAVKSVGEQTLKNVVKSGLKEGIKYGGAFGSLQGLQNTKNGIPGQLYSAGTGAVTGAAAGALAGPVLGATAYGLSKGIESLAAKRAANLAEISKLVDEMPRFGEPDKIVRWENKVNTFYNDKNMPLFDLKNDLSLSEVNKIYDLKSKQTLTPEDVSSITSIFKNRLAKASDTRLSPQTMLRELTLHADNTGLRPGFARIPGKEPVAQGGKILYRGEGPANVGGSHYTSDLKNAEYYAEVNKGKVGAVRLKPEAKTLDVSQKYELNYNGGREDLGNDFKQKIVSKAKNDGYDAVYLGGVNDETIILNKNAVTPVAQGGLGDIGGKTVYHATNKQFDNFDISKAKTDMGGAKAIFFSDTPEGTKYYQRGENSRVIKTSISPGAKIFDYKSNQDIINKYIDSLSGYNDSQKASKMRLLSSGDWGTIEGKHFQDFLKKNGFDGFRVMDMTGHEATGITNTKVIQSLSPSKGGLSDVSSPKGTRINPEMVSGSSNKTGLPTQLENVSPIRTKVASESSLKPIISNKGKLNLDRLAIDDTGKQALQDINQGIQTSVISNKSVIERAKMAKGRNKPMTDAQMQDLLAQQLKNRQEVVDLSAKFSKAKSEGASEAELGKIMLELANQSRTAQQGGTLAGRLLQAQNIIADKSAAPMQKILALLDNAGIKEDKYLKDAVKVNWENPVDVVKFYRKYVPPKLGDVLTEIRYTNMLSSPLTHITNIASNFIQTGVVAPVEKTITGLLDAVRSGITKKEREYYATAGINYTKGYLKSLPEAIQKAKNVMNQTEMSLKPDMEFIPTGVGGPLQAYTTPLRALEAMDQFFKTLVEGGVTSELKSGPKMLPQTKIASQAAKEAEYRLFRQSFDPNGELGQGIVLQMFDRWNSAINGLRRLPGGKWVLPFLQTPTNILKQGLEYSPLGVSTMYGAEKPVEQLSKALIGAGVYATAYQLASSGLTSWSAPTGEKERALYYAAGMQPYSIKIGDKWVSFSKLGPLSYPIAMAAALHDSERTGYDRTKLENMAKGISGTLAFFGDQSYVSSIGDLVDAIQGGINVGPTAIAGQASNMLGQLIPYKSFLTWLGRITDPTYRKAQTFSEKLIKDLPILGKNLEPYTDIKGNPSQRDLPLLNAISPYKVTQEKSANVPMYNMYEQNKIKTQQINKAKEKIKSGQSVSSIDGVYLNMDGSTVDVGKVVSMPSTTGYDKVKKQEATFKIINDVLALPIDQQQEALQKLGVSQEDAQYYQVAQSSVEAKTAYVLDGLNKMISGGATRDQALGALIKMRNEVNGAQIASDSVLKALYDQNIISKSDYDNLRKIKVSNGQITRKVTGRSKKAKLPTYNYKALMKPTKVAVRKAKRVQRIKL